MRVQLVARRGTGNTGTGRYAESLGRALAEIGVQVRFGFPTPVVPWAPVRRGLARLGLGVEAFFESYPLRADPAEADVYHLTSQTLATLLLRRAARRPAVVTVLDIFPYLLRRDPALRSFRHPVDELFYRLALSGLRRADALIAISAHTRDSLVRTLGLPPSRIHVTHLGVAHDVFRPTDVPSGFRAEQGLDPDRRYVLYVGSDDPRKNLPALVRAFALLRRGRPDVGLLLIGPRQFGRARADLERLIAELGLSDAVVSVADPSDRDLVLFYNSAAVFVLPSPHEGFGLPALEAMACGVPVVVARGGALPEVVGDAGRQVAPEDVAGLADTLARLLEDGPEASRLAEAGRRRAAAFSWERAAGETHQVYTALRR